MDYPELRRELTEIVEELYRERLITPGGGNISLRLPDGGGCMITPSMMYKGSLKPENMVLLREDGTADDAKNRPSIETPMHLKVYELNPAVGAIIHTHAPNATILGMYDNLKVPPFTVEALRFAALPVVPFCIPGSHDLVERVAEALEINPSAQALLLRNHGLLTFGRNLRAAANISISLEEACHMAITCRLLGETPYLVPEDSQDLLKNFLAL